MSGILRRRPKDSVNEAGKSLWEDTKELIDKKQMTPIISNFSALSLFGGETIALKLQEWAETKLPLLDEESRDLARVAQVWSIQQNNQRKTKREYVQFLKDMLYYKALNDPDLDFQTRSDLSSGAIAIDDLSVSAFARDIGYPRLHDPNQDALRLLAELPLPLYITTCYHDFIEQALASTTEQKEPESVILYWNEALQNIDSIYDREPNYTPDVKRPLVYHLFGRDEYPESLILTEDDYLDWLVGLAEMRREVKVGGAQTNKHTIPEVVQNALSRNALLVLGFGAYSWDFRVLFRSLIIGWGASRMTDTRLPRGICMQMDRAAKTPDEQQRAREYVEKYFAQTSRFGVFWGNERECVQKLITLSKARN